jgi:signal transduction histidine kinase
VKKSVAFAHRFARELRPTVLDDMGLIPALKAFIRDYTERTKLQVQLTAHTNVKQLNRHQQTVLYRVTQSSLSNVDKHAHATRVKVTLRKLRKSILLKIHDNGKSFDVQRVLYNKRHVRLGLLGSRERVEMVGGIFKVESRPGHGTTISAEIPLVSNVPPPRRIPLVKPFTEGKVVARYSLHRHE